MTSRSVSLRKTAVGAAGGNGEGDNTLGYLNNFPEFYTLYLPHCCMLWVRLADLRLHSNFIDRVSSIVSDSADDGHSDVQE